MLRRIMYPRPASSLGRRRVALDTQASNPAFSEFVEHARWSSSGVTFATLHIVGSGNFTEPCPARTPADDEEARRRLEAVLSWLRDIFARAKAQSAAFDWDAEGQAPFRPLLVTTGATPSFAFEPRIAPAWKYW
jgi:hypothetical protein